jgi:hypothetical protein
MEAARTSETSVDIKLRTRQYIPEDSELVIEFPCRPKSETINRLIERVEIYSHAKG